MYDDAISISSRTRGVEERSSTIQIALVIDSVLGVTGLPGRAEVRSHGIESEPESGPESDDPSQRSGRLSWTVACRRLPLGRSWINGLLFVVSNKDLLCCRKFFISTSNPIVSVSRIVRGYYELSVRWTARKARRIPHGGVRIRALPHFL